MGIVDSAWGIGSGVGGWDLGTAIREQEDKRPRVPVTN